MSETIMTGAANMAMADVVVRKPKEMLLMSYNLFKGVKPELLLLKGLDPCFQDAIPDAYITESSQGGGFEGVYKEDESAFKSKEELSVSVGVKGSYGAFSASMQMDYSKATEISSTSFYSSYAAKLDIGTVSFKAEKDQTLALLNKDMVAALKAIDSLAKAKDFTDNWGTHLVTRISTGGMLFISMEAHTGTKDEKEKLALAVEGKYDGVVSLEATAEVVKETSQSASFKNLTQKVSAVGGDPIKAAIIKPGEMSTFEDWIKSCTMDTGYCIADAIEIFSLVTGTAHDMLKRYITLEMLAFSLEHPMIFTGSTQLQPFNTNTVSAPLTATQDFKIVGGGANITSGSSSYLLGSYPQGGQGGAPQSWGAACHDCAIASDPNTQSITAYAIAVFDPEDVLDVCTKTANGSRPGVGGDNATASLPADWILTSGGLNFVNNGNSAHKYVYSSYATDSHSWYADGSDYVVPASDTPLTVYAVGIKSKDAALSITAKYIDGNQSQGQHCKNDAAAQTCICGGGVHTWNDQGFGNLVQQSYPSFPTVWHEQDDDLDGHVTFANAQAFAITLHATVKL